MEKKIILVNNKVEWEKLKAFAFKFIGRLNGYEIHLDATNNWAIWHIEKDGKMVTHCTSHPPAKGELDARVKAEKILLEIIRVNEVFGEVFHDPKVTVSKEQTK